MQWLEYLTGKKVVIKFGGNAMINPQLVRDFADDVAKMRLGGVDVVVVHGGGPQISKALEDAGIETTFVDGLRTTPDEALPIIRDVLLEQIGKPLAELISSFGVESVALNGLTEGLFLAEITRADVGRVGEVFAVRDGYLSELLRDNVVPVISSIAADESGQLVNVNADLVASSVAAVLNAEELIMLTDVDGIYESYPDPDTLLGSVSVADLEKLAPNLDSGMVPKVEACLAAKYAGVSIARVINGSVPHALLRLNENPESCGTRVEG